MIIQINSSDEFDKIISKIKSFDESELILVLPENCKTLQNNINLRLLAQYATDLHKSIYLQTDDKKIVKYAQKFGLKVYSSDDAVAASSDKDSSEKRRLAKKSTRYGDKLIVIMLILVAVFSLFYILTPKAFVVIKPNIINFSESIVFDFSQLNGLQEKQTRIEMAREIPATGTKTVGVSKSTGSIVLLSQKQKDILIPKGTIVRTKGDIPFITLEDVIVPKVTTQYFMDVPVGLEAGKAEVAIEALNSGGVSNVAAGRIEQITGFDIDVRNPEPTTGGEDAVLSVVTNDDIAKTQDLVTRGLRQSVSEKLANDEEIRYLLQETFRFDIDWQEISELGDELDEAYASAIGYGSVYWLDEDKLGKQLLGAVSHLIPEQFILIPESIQIEDLWVSSEEDFALHVDISGNARGDIQVARIANNLLGKPLDDIVEVTAAFPEVSAIEVERTNSDKRLPIWNRWLEVKVQKTIY